jgi:hypothetical protein
MAYLGKTPSQAVRSRYYFTASGGETSLAPAQVTGLSFTDANYVDVSLNGVALVSGTDYTATPSTNTISSLSALTASDVVEIVVYDTFSVFGGSVNGDFNISGGDLTLGDNDKAIFGAGSDLQIYHDSATNHSIITESGTGNLLLQADNLVLQKANGGNNYLKATANAQVDLYYNNAIKLATTSTGVDVTGVITTDGMTTSANINFGDDDKAVFGAGSDLQIYHNGTDSFIDETNASGWLYIRGNNTVIGKYTGETYFKGITDGAVELYHDNSKKFETTSTGVDVTGTVTADGLAVDGNASITASLPTFTITGQGRVNGFEIAGTSGNTKLTEKSNNGIEFGTNNTTRVTITSGGSVGIGTSSPTGKLHIKATSDSVNDALRIESSINSHYYTLSSDAGNGSFRITKNGTERMRIDSSGNVLVGTTDTSPFNNTSGTGTSLSGGDVQIASSSSESLYLNRIGSDGRVVSIRKGGSFIGGIDVSTSQVTYNQTSDYRLKENVSYTWDATARLKQLKPARFNYIVDPDNIVDGFLAHEVSEACPSAITGEKDAVDADGNIDPQCIDHSKLVPLLVKTIQELEARLTDTETRLTALENAE